MPMYPASDAIDALLRTGEAVSKSELRAFLHNLHSYTVHSASDEQARTPAQRGAETLSVADFGAVGDGSTDNRGAFAALSSYVATRMHPVIVFVPAGFYYTSARWVFSTPQVSLIGEGFDRSTIICDAGLKFHYPQPQVQGVSVEPKTPPGTVGILFENSWQGLLRDVRIKRFAKCFHLLLSAEGQELLPGNAPGSLSVSQRDRHTAWPTRWEMAEDVLGRGTTTSEHWGSMVTLTRIENCHMLADDENCDCIVLENTIHDSTVAGQYGRFAGQLGGPNDGVFFTGTVIEGGHLMSSHSGACLVIGDGVHTTRMTDTYLDIRYIGVRMHYGARDFKSVNVTYDGARNRPPLWLPHTAYAIGDEVTATDWAYKYVCTTAGTSAPAAHNGVANSSGVGALAGSDAYNNKGRLPLGWNLADPAPAVVGIGALGVASTGEHYIDMDFRLNTSQGSNTWVSVAMGPKAEWDGGWQRSPGETVQVRYKAQLIETDMPDIVPNVIQVEVQGMSSSGSYQEGTSDPFDNEVAFQNGDQITRVFSHTMADADTDRVRLLLTVKFNAGQTGSVRVRVQGLQMNTGGSASEYVATEGMVRAKAGTGPQGTSTGIADGTVVWRYAGIADSKFAADKQCIIDGRRGGNITILGSDTATDAPVTPQAVPNPPNASEH